MTTQATLDAAFARRQKRKREQETMELESWLPSTFVEDLNPSDRRLIANLSREDPGLAQEVAKEYGLLYGEKETPRHMDEPTNRVNALLREGVSLRVALITLAANDPLQYPGIYRNHFDLVVRRGKAWTAEEADVPTDQPWNYGDGKCYPSAHLLAEDTGLSYAEGWALLETTVDGQTGRGALHHAWTVDEATGRVVEPSWPEPATEYIGNIFHMDQVRGTTERTGFYGLVINDQDDGYDLLSRGLLGIDYFPKGGD